MKNCRKCGTTNIDNAIFCRNCGEKIEKTRNHFIMMIISAIIVFLVVFSIYTVQYCNDISAPTEVVTTNSVEDYMEDLSWTNIDLSESDLDRFSLEDLRLLRNAIFAKHGYIFSNPKLYKYFQKYQWYFPTSNNVYDELTITEKRNVQIIKNHEKKSLK